LGVKIQKKIFMQNFFRCEAVSKWYFTRHCDGEARSKTSLRGAQRRSKPLKVNIWINSVELRFGCFLLLAKVLTVRNDETGVLIQPREFCDTINMIIRNKIYRSAIFQDCE
jgi:hypothetical protein